MAQSRGEVLNALVDDITRTTLRSANLSPEDRLIAGERIRQAVRTEAMGAHGDVVAASHGDANGPEAEAFEGYVHADPQSRPEQDAGSPSRRLAAELVASDDRINAMEPARTERAQEYIAHAATAGAQAAAGKVSGGPSQAPAAARGLAAAGSAAGPAGGSAGGPAAGPAGGAGGPAGPSGPGAAAAGPVGVPVVAVKAGVYAAKDRPGTNQRGSSIG